MSFETPIEQMGFAPEVLAALDNFGFVNLGEILSWMDAPANDLTRIGGITSEMLPHISERIVAQYSTEQLAEIAAEVLAEGDVELPEGQNLGKAMVEVVERQEALRVANDHDIRELELTDYTAKLLRYHGYDTIEKLSMELVDDPEALAYARGLGGVHIVEIQGAIEKWNAKQHEAYVAQHGEGFLPQKVVMGVEPPVVIVDEEHTFPEGMPEVTVPEHSADVVVTSTLDEVLDGDFPEMNEKEELELLRSVNRKLSQDLYQAQIENDMHRRFHMSIDDHDRHVFMQSVVFLAAQAVNVKHDLDGLQEFFEGQGDCLHPEEELRDTGFGVVLCGVCKKHVDPEPPAVCGHEDTIAYGTVGLIQCLKCGTNLPREHFTRVEEDTVKLADAVGVSIPKGQPKLPVGLAPRERDFRQARLDALAEL